LIQLYTIVIAYSSVSRETIKKNNVSRGTLSISNYMTKNIRGDYINYFVSRETKSRIGKHIVLAYST
jgi:hypothetical protein